MVTTKSLPNEIFALIFALLHQKDKVECMLVCHQWKEIISTGCLFQTLCVYTLDGLKNTITKMKEDPEQTLKIRRLVIDFLTEDEFDLNPLLPLFPNLESLLLLAPEGKQEIDEATIYPWHKYITHITECTTTTVAYQLLSRTVCPNLTTLSVAEESIGVEPKNIIPFLGNAPALEHLEIWPEHLRFSELNFMHSKLPRLKSLHVSTFTLDGSDFTANIEPAINMTECSFIKAKTPPFNNETEIKLIKFISLKYPNLIKLEYSHNTKKAEKTANYHDRLSRLGWIPLFKKLGSSLKNVCICGENEPPGLFKMLDDGNCKLDQLRFKHLNPPKVLELSGSNQVQYLQLLKLDDITIVDFKWLRHLVNLKKLFMHCNQTRKLAVDMNEILQNSPKLKMLSLEFITLDVDSSDPATFPLEDLSMRCVKFPETFDQFLAKHVPRLQKLKLSCCDLESKTFDLSPLDLLLFEIENILSYKRRNLMVKTHKGNKKRWYPLEELGRSYLTFYRQSNLYDPTVNPRVHPVTKDEGFDAPMFTLICNSLYDFNYVED
jgi:hypothetical protein